MDIAPRAAVIDGESTLMEDLADPEDCGEPGLVVLPFRQSDHGRVAAQEHVGRFRVERRTQLLLQAAGEDPAFRTTLTVFVPAGSSVGVETVNAGVSVEGVNGELDVDTVNGGVKIAGARSPVEVETMTGAIEIQALSVPMELSSISGTVTVDGASGEVQIETVSGRVSAAGEMVSALGIKTTTGPVDFRGSIARAGEIDIETFSSPVKLRLPKTTKAVFDLRTFGAKIQSQFCTGTPVTRIAPTTACSSSWIIPRASR